MYRCNSCKHVFDEFEKKYEKVGLSTDSLPPAYFEYDVCPNCKEDDYEPVEWCKNCEDEVTEDDYCESCLTATRYHLNRCITGIMADTTGTHEEVIEMIKEIIKEKE